MNNIFLVRHHTESGVVPSSSALLVGELALNSADSRLFTKNTAGQVVWLNPLYNALTASLAYTASYFSGSISNADTSISASYALTASFAQNALTANSATTAAFAPTNATANSGSFTGSFTGSVLGSASFAITASAATSLTFIPETASFAQNALTANSATSATFAPTNANANSGSFTGSFTGSLLGSASFATTASAATSITFLPDSASYSTTASYALTASYAMNGGSGPGITNTGSFTGSFTGEMTASDFYVLAGTDPRFASPVWLTNTNFYTASFMPGLNGRMLSIASTGSAILHVQYGNGVSAGDTFTSIRSRGTTIGAHQSIFPGDSIFYQSARFVKAQGDLFEGFSWQAVIPETGSSTALTEVRFNLADNETFARTKFVLRGANFLFTGSETGDLGSSSFGNRPRHVYIASGAFIGSKVPGLTNNLEVSGTVWAIAYTGSLLGSSSFATTSSAATSITFIPVSSSYALTASYVASAAPSVSASYASNGLKNRLVVTISSSIIAQNATLTGALSMSAGFMVYTVSTLENARLRLYGRSDLRDLDVSRGTNVEPTGSHGVILDVVTTGNPRRIIMSPIALGANVEDNYNDVIYYTVTNTATSSLAVSASIVYVPLEQYP
jgi:hypothetical protein